MALYLISYDLRQPGRNYDALYRQLADWGAARVLQSLWLVNLTGNAEQVRETLRASLDPNDGIVVIELKSNSNWAVAGGQAAGISWLRTHIP